MRSAAQIELLLRDRLIVNEELGALVAYGLQLFCCTCARQLCLSVVQGCAIGALVDLKH
jgi:hypothetical protein